LVEKENYNVGTPIYMPKESLAANIYNEKTDVWALGITLYEMVFGFVPYRGKSEQDLRAEIERGILHFPDQKPISEDLKNFISSCLHNDSFRRISIREMRKHPWIQKLEKKLKFNLSQN
jgi:SNF-related kinase